MKGLILAAGLGTRLQPLTSQTPKALLCVKNVPLLEYAILKLKNAGISDIIINIHHFAEQIVDFINSKKSFGINIEFSDESNHLMDTGGGIKKAEWFLKGLPFIVYNADILTTLNLTDFITEHSANSAIATLAVQKRDASRYLLFKNNQLCGWKKSGEEPFYIGEEKKQEYTAFGFSGIHILNPEIFNYIPNDKPCSITKIYLEIAKNKNIFSFNHTGDDWYDVGKLPVYESLNNSEIDFQRFI